MQMIRQSAQLSLVFLANLSTRGWNQVCVCVGLSAFSTLQCQTKQTLERWAFQQTFPCMFISKSIGTWETPRPLCVQVRVSFRRSATFDKQSNDKLLSKWDVASNSQLKYSTQFRLSDTWLLLGDGYFRIFDKNSSLAVCLTVARISPCWSHDWCRVRGVFMFFEMSFLVYSMRNLATCGCDHQFPG